MNDDALSKLLLEYGSSHVEPTATRRSGAQRGTGLILLTIAMILCWIIGALAIVLFFIVHFDWLRQLAERKAPPAQNDVFEWFEVLLLALSPSIVGGVLAIIRANAIRSAKLREVNATLIDILSHLRKTTPPE
ncbi:MAG TPA: hypothetical protein VGJ26_22175 [Pirellulales bacterium]